MPQVFLNLCGKAIDKAFAREYNIEEDRGAQDKSTVGKGPLARVPHGKGKCAEEG